MPNSYSYANPGPLCPCQAHAHLSSIISRLTSFEQRLAAVELQFRGTDRGVHPSSHLRGETEPFPEQTNDPQPDARVASKSTMIPAEDILSSNDDDVLEAADEVRDNPLSHSTGSESDLDDSFEQPNVHPHLNLN